MSGRRVRIAGMLNANRAGNDVRIGRARDVGQRAPQMQVRGPERRRRFGPHDQPRRIRLLTLRTHAQLLQRLQRLHQVVQRPVGFEDGNVRLHQRRAMPRGRRGRLYQLAGVQDQGSTPATRSAGVCGAYRARETPPPRRCSPARSRTKVRRRPVTVAMRDSGMLSICVLPSRSQGKPVM